MHTIDSKEYEKSLYEKLLYDFPPPMFEVIQDLKVKGRYSRGTRQIDVAVCRSGECQPFLVAEAKCHQRTVEIRYIEAFITNLKDVGAKIGLMVSSSGFTAPGKRLAESFGIDLRILSIEDALETKWYPIARQIFPWDWAFHPEMAAALSHINKGASSKCVIDAIEQIPFEEWDAFVTYALSNHSLEAKDFLEFVTLNHHDDCWRFNAIQKLIDSNLFNKELANRLVNEDQDTDIIELIKQSGVV